MHDNGTQTIKAEVVEPIVEAQETCREEANTSSSYSPSPRTVYTCNDGKVSPTRLTDTSVRFSRSPSSWRVISTLSTAFVLFFSQITCLFICHQTLHVVFVMFPVCSHLLHLLFDMHSWRQNHSSKCKHKCSPSASIQNTGMKDAISQTLIDRLLTSSPTDNKLIWCFLIAVQSLLVMFSQSPASS